MKTSYLPVEWVYREVIEEEIAKESCGKIFYFGDAREICSAEGKIIKMSEEPHEGVFIYLDSDSKIRIDLIITLFGKPGAAYAAYDAYANACLDCMGGYEKEDLE